MLGHALGAARSTGGLVTPTVGAAVTGAGYDIDFDRLPADGAPVAPVECRRSDALSLRGRLLVRARADRARSQLCRQGGDRRRRTRAARRRLRGCRRRRGDLRAARRRPARRAAPSRSQGAASPRAASRSAAGGAGESSQHHLIDPATGRPRRPWRDVSVAAASCLAADVAAKAALLLGGSRALVARPTRPRRPLRGSRRRRAPERDVAAGGAAAASQHERRRLVHRPLGGIVAYLLLSASVVVGAAALDAREPRLAAFRGPGGAPLPGAAHGHLHRAPRRGVAARPRRPVLAVAGARALQSSYRPFAVSLGIVVRGAARRGRADEPAARPDPYRHWRRVHYPDARRLARAPPATCCSPARDRSEPWLDRARQRRRWLPLGLALAPRLARAAAPANTA